MNKSPNQSPSVVMTPHHIRLYPMVEVKKQCNHQELQPYEENARGTA
jgi:hypothetical protein